MFLKKLHRKKNGKGHTYWALAESYRTARGSRHRVVAYLGELKSRERKGWAELAAKFGGGQAALVQGDLFDAGSETDAVPNDVIVNVRGARRAGRSQGRGGAASDGSAGGAVQRAARPAVV